MSESKKRRVRIVLEPRNRDDALAAHQGTAANLRLPTDDELRTMGIDVARAEEENAGEISPVKTRVDEVLETKARPAVESSLREVDAEQARAVHGADVAERARQVVEVIQRERSGLRGLVLAGWYLAVRAISDSVLDSSR